MNIASEDDRSPEARSLVRAVVIGNSGSGKSTLAGHLARARHLPLLDLDTVAWEPGKVAVPRDAEVARRDVAAFISQHEQWIIEGCYAALARGAARADSVLIFLNPGVAACQAHCRARPWEPHKYASQAQQDGHLDFLLKWVATYETREDDMGLAAHRVLFEQWPGPRWELNEPLNAAAMNELTKKLGSL